MDAFGAIQPAWGQIIIFLSIASMALGAFAAHGVKDPRAAELLKTGASYEFMHCMATLACATFMQVGARRARFAPAFFLAGVVLFSGSLYAMAFGAPRALGMVTPIGGLAFMAGWLWLAWNMVRSV